MDSKCFVSKLPFCGLLLRVISGINCPRRAPLETDSEMETERGDLVGECSQVIHLAGSKKDGTGQREKLVFDVVLKEVSVDPT